MILRLDIIDWRLDRMATKFDLDIQYSVKLLDRCDLVQGEPNYYFHP